MPGYGAMPDPELARRADEGDIAAIQEEKRRWALNSQSSSSGGGGGGGAGLIVVPVVWLLQLLLKPLLKALEWRPVQIAIGLFLLYELVPLVRSSISAMSHGHANVLNFFLLWLVGMSLAMGLVRFASKRIYEFMNRHPSLIFIFVGGPVALMVFALMPVPAPAGSVVKAQAAPPRNIVAKHRAHKKQAVPVRPDTAPTDSAPTVPSPGEK